MNGLTFAVIAVSQLFIFLYSFVPPGTTAFTSNKLLFVDKTEVTNRSWQEYIGYQKNNFGALSTEYKKTLPDSAIWHFVYKGNIERASISSFAELPVVGITVIQATEFCQWRMDRVNEKYHKNVLYRLPTLQEWTLIYRASNKSIKNLDNALLEMTSKEGLAIGKYTTSGAAAMLNDSLTRSYAGAGNWLGFRCVAELIK